jgi:hypothetical protein
MHQLSEPQYGAMLRIELYINQSTHKQFMFTAEKHLMKIRPWNT